jgi:hypothetical protein
MVHLKRRAFGSTFPPNAFQYFCLYTLSSVLFHFPPHCGTRYPILAGFIGTQLALLESDQVPSAIFLPPCAALRKTGAAGRDELAKPPSGKKIAKTHSNSTMKAKPTGKFRINAKV